LCCLRNFSGTATLIKERLATQKIKTMQTKTSPLKITPLHAFDDNYIWCIETQESDHFVVVDPGDASVVTSYALKIQKKLSAILVTHHHGDHTGGVAQLTAHYRDIPVYGPENSPYQGITHTLKEYCNVNILGVNFNVMEIPGHTLDHIAYFNHQQEILFCGDTLFLAGCGRVFEGTPKQMHHSLSKIMELPPTTRAYPTHEYSLANLEFAMAVDENNAALKLVQKKCKDKRSASQVTLPTTLAQEAAINPFLRVDNKAVIASANKYKANELHHPSEVFAALRQWKNDF
jgi:hydroxyacylglutathione hydrolase